MKEVANDLIVDGLRVYSSYSAQRCSIIFTYSLQMMPYQDENYLITGGGGWGFDIRGLFVTGMPKNCSGV